MATDDGIKAMQREAALNVAISEDEAEAVRVIMGRRSELQNLAKEVGKMPVPGLIAEVPEEPVAVAEVKAPAATPVMLDFDGDDFAPGSSAEIGAVESDDDVTHYHEDGDPEQFIGDEVEYDLGSDD